MAAVSTFDSCTEMVGLALSPAILISPTCAAQRRTY